MGVRTIASTANPRIWIRTSADLVLQGGTQPEVSIDIGNEHNLRVQQVGDTLHIESSSDCQVMVPDQATVEIDKVGGDAVIRSFAGALKIRKISGDAQMQQVGAVDIERLGGDLVIQQASGNVQVQKAGGDVVADHVDGSFTLAAGGDLSLAEVGSVSVTVGGDISVKVTHLDPAGYDIRAGGDVVCILPDNASLELDLAAGSHEIDLRLPGATQVFENRSLKRTIDQGGPLLKVNAGGDLMVATPALRATRGNTAYWTEDLRGMGERIRQQVEESFRAADFSTRLSSEIGKRTETITQQALQQAQQRIQSVLQHMEQTPAASPQPETKSGFPPVIEFEPVAEDSEEPDEPVSDEERMIILQMLQEKKVSVAEAERLLAALEGRSLR